MVMKITQRSLMILIMWKLLIVAFLVGSCTCTPVDHVTLDEPVCGYDRCQDAEKGVLNVHIVAHTHDDVGWLKTVDQYYYGSRNYIQNAGVQYILDSVIKELWAEPKRRFIYVETAFFWKWWNHQTDSVKHKVQALVRQGRLQLVGGAWSMNDEATTHYQSTIDQFTFGLRKLHETFGPCARPRVGWQIDPFGHSREFASLLAGMAYDGLFLGRIDYQDKSLRLKEKRMEMIWRGDDDLGKSSDIFTGVLYNTYSPPPGFCFDIMCSDEPIVDDVDSPIYNVEDRIERFMNYVKSQAKSYKSGNVLITMGGDFNYQDAATWFINLDKLIQYTNMKAAKDGLNVKLFYSTPDCYLKAVKDENPTLTTKTDDFFPYASDQNSYWTGYFTSRPTIKYFEREGNNYLQSLKQLQVLAGLKEHNKFVLNELRGAMGVMQHHDAVTGTEKQHVSRDYERIMDQAIEDALLIARQAFTKIIQGEAEAEPIFSYDRCRFNQSECATSENNDKFVVTIYNPLAWKVDATPIRIPVVDGNYQVYAPNGDQIVTQMVPLPETVNAIQTRKSKATHALMFLAYNVKPFGYKNFYVKKVQKLAKRDVKDPEIDTYKVAAEKRKTDLYENVNDYWKHIKEQPYIDIKNIEDQTIKERVRLNYDNHKVDDKELPANILRVSNEEAPLAKKIFVNTDNEKYVDPTLEILKDDKEQPFDKNIEELEKLLKEKRLKVEKQTDGYKLREEEGRKVNFPILNEDEMRMLADDPRIVEKSPQDDFLQNPTLKLHVNNTTGEVTYLSLSDGLGTYFNIDYLYYPGFIGDNKQPKFRSSGAYIFRPNATSPNALDNNRTTNHIVGPVVEEFQFKITDYLSGVVRLYNDTNLNFVEHDWLVGPIPIEDGVGKEIIVRYASAIVNNGAFFTDSNGRQMLKRQLDKRPDWDLVTEEPVAANYYPVTNKIYIEDSSKRLTVLTDRSEGGTSLREGDVELMLHRRLLHDDAFGVGEALNETMNGKGLVVAGRHRIFLSPAGDKLSQVNEKKQLLQLHLQPQIFVSKTDMEFDQWVKLKNCFGGLKNSLPDGAHMLTLEPWYENKLLLRLENYLEKKDDNNVIIVDISDIFGTLKLRNLKETTLAANLWLEDKEKWTWDNEKNFIESFNEVKDFKIKLEPKQIRTFLVDYEFTICDNNKNGVCNFTG